MISIDTLRADHLSAYGYRKIRTPHIDSFAEQGTVFTDASSQIPLTLGDAYLRAGKTEDAVREWTTALTSHPDYVPAAQALGEFYTARKDWPKALRYLQQALTAAPSDTAIRFELGMVEKNLGMAKAACQQTPSMAACRDVLK